MFKARNRIEEGSYMMYDCAAMHPSGQVPVGVQIIDRRVEGELREGDGEDHIKSLL